METAGLYAMIYDRWSVCYNNTNLPMILDADINLKGIVGFLLLPVSIILPVAVPSITTSLRNVDNSQRMFRHPLTADPIIPPHDPADPDWLPWLHGKQW